VSPTYSLDIARLAHAYASGSLTPAQVVNDICDAIEATRDANPAWIHVPPRAHLLEQAAALEADRLNGAQLPLYGIPFAVKDNIDVAGMPTTAACPAFAYEPKATAPVVQKLLAAGALLIGKTNLDQFATGLVGVRSPYGACRNVFDGRYISGGSSSGSAVAVASHQVSFALGTDTAGSGRVPAAFNNIVGLKPTRGLVSTTGIVPACRSLDCVSVLAQSCAGALKVLDTIEAYDPSDPYSRRAGYAESFSVERFSFALPRRDQLEFYGDGAYAQLFEQAALHLEAIGGTRREIDLSAFLAAQEMLYEGPWIAERAAQLETFINANPEAVHPVTKRVIESAKSYSAADLFRAQHRLAALKRETEAVWETADVLAVPGAPTIYTIAEVEADPLTLNARLGRYTNFVNLLDLAAITVPAGFRADGLPFGVTLIGPAFSDRALVALAARFSASPASDSSVVYSTSHKKEPGTVRIAVVGAHLSGMPLNSQLTERGARLLRTVRTAPRYRLYALNGSPPPKPGLVHVENDGDGGCIEVEVWAMNERRFGDFVSGIPAPLGIGTVTLEDGEEVKGFLCEHYAVTGCTDITALGGWRKYAPASP
jgi:allophanate hydrolase